MAVGALGGAALLPRLRFGMLGLIVAGMLIEAAGLGLLALAPHLVPALGAAVLAGAANGLTTATMFSARARWAPPHLHAQVFTSAAGLYALGAALAGPALTLGARPATALAAAAVSGAVASGSRWPAGRSGG